MFRYSSCCPGFPLPAGCFICFVDPPIAVLRKKYQVDAHVAKLDIRAAFDSLSHAAIVSYLMHCDPCPEAALLWRLCSQNRLLPGLGTDTWHTKVEQGIMQGSSYSADLFARIIDFHLRGLQDRWSGQFPRWRDSSKAPSLLALR